MDVVVSGHLCLDLIPRMGNLPLTALSSMGRLYEIDALEISTGGAVSNTGLALHKLGVDVCLMAVIGDDTVGQLILKIIQSFDPALADHVTILAGQAGSYTIVLSPQDADRLLLQWAGTNTSFGAQHIDYELASRAKIFHLGYPPLLPSLSRDNGAELVEIFRRIHQSGVVTSLDMSLPDPNGASGKVDWLVLLKQSLPYIDIFMPSIEEILFMLRRDDFHKWGNNWINEIDRRYLDQLTDEIIGMGSSIVGFKLSDRGIYIRTAKNLSESFLQRLSIDVTLWQEVGFWHPAFNVNVVGTTGAGDSAYAGFLSALVKGLNPQDAVRMACAVGAANVEEPDALGGIHHWDEMVARVQSGWQTLGHRLAGF